MIADPEPLAELLRRAAHALETGHPNITADLADRMAVTFRYIAELADAGVPFGPTEPWAVLSHAALDKDQPTTGEQP